MIDISFFLGGGGIFNPLLFELEAEAGGLHRQEGWLSVHRHLLGSFGLSKLV